MNPLRHRSFPILAASSLLIAAAGCASNPERQSIFNMRRVTQRPIEVDTGSNAKVAKTASRAPAPDPLPPSNGVDVPLFDPR